MKIFLSHKLTGENHESLKEILGSVCRQLNLAGHDVYCSFFELDYLNQIHNTVEQNYQYCLNKMNQYDLMLALIYSPKKSTGMQLELENAQKLNKPLIVAIKRELVNDYQEFLTPATKIIYFETFPELYQKLNSQLNKN